MFTGIVEEVGKVISSGDGLLISASVIMDDLKLGDSVSVNGICLTVTSMTKTSFSVDVMPETRSRSNIGVLRNGDRVNLERAMTLGGRMGGHIVQGHIDATGRIVSMKPEGKALLVSIEAPASVMRYIVEKGFIAVDGISLTVVDHDRTSFRVSMVGFTQQATVLSFKKVGDIVNLESDIIGKYVEQFTQARSGGITSEFLMENGFLTS